MLALVAGGAPAACSGATRSSSISTSGTYGFQNGAWQDSAIRMAPLLLIAAGLTVIFRANIWNLGYDGQFLLGAALVGRPRPLADDHLPKAFAIVVLFLVAAAVGAAWTIIPAVLKARYGTNEIITTLMMSFIGVDMANILIKGPFQDATVRTPQTQSSTSTRCCRTFRARDPHRADRRIRHRRGRRTSC